MAQGADVSTCATVVIAAVAVLGLFATPIVKWWRKARLIIPNAERYDFHAPAPDFRKDSSRTIETDIDYLIPVKNVGRVAAMKSVLTVDCVLTRDGTGDGFSPLHFGVPLRMCWPPAKLSEDISGKDTAYCRLISFSKEQNGEDEDLKGADSEDVLTCYLCADSFRVGSCGRIALATGTQMDVYLHFGCKAIDVDSATSGWLCVHWSGETVNAKNFKIRKASMRERWNLWGVRRGLAKRGCGVA